jgi:hypothetical protein
VYGSKSLPPSGTDRDLHTTFERLLQRREDTIMSTAEKLKSQGKAEGMAEGINKGRGETLLRLIGKRCGPPTPEVSHRLHGATAADLDRWTDRILEAKSLAELFAD